MRVGVGGGPFYASGSTRGSGPWLIAFFALIAVVGLIAEYPVVAGLVGAALVAGIFGLRRVSKARRLGMESASVDQMWRHDPSQACPRCEGEGHHVAGCPLKLSDPSRNVSP